MSDKGVIEKVYVDRENIPYAVEHILDDMCPVFRTGENRFLAAPVSYLYKTISMVQIEYLSAMHVPRLRDSRR